MKIKLGIVMDAIEKIHYQKDSSLSMLWEANARHYEIYYFEQQDLFFANQQSMGRAKKLAVFRDENNWYAYTDFSSMPLSELDVILIRKDPPFDLNYLYTTYLLEEAERRGTLIINRPQSLRDANEKLFATQFSHCMPPTIVTQNKEDLWQFWQAHHDIVCKPLDGMGGASIFRLKIDEINANVIFDTMTQHETVFIMAQAFIPDIQHGDKRILIINGKPFSHALARIPQGNDWRGNLAVGAKGIAQPLSPRDQFICEAVAPVLKERGLYFVGLDVIGDYLTEINVTSPTGIRELEAATGMNAATYLFDTIEHLLNHR